MSCKLETLPCAPREDSRVIARRAIASALPERPSASAVRMRLARLGR